jgi:hypothetical protein
LPVFFISLRFERVDNLGANRIPPETGILISSVNRSYSTTAVGVRQRKRGRPEMRTAFDSFAIRSDSTLLDCGCIFDKLGNYASGRQHLRIGADPRQLLIAVGVIEIVDLSKRGDELLGG